jgi:hypothetical protein
MFVYLTYSALDMLWLPITVAVHNEKRRLEQQINRILRFIPFLRCCLSLSVGSRPLRVGGLKTCQSGIAGHSAMFESNILWGSEARAGLSLRILLGRYAINIPVVTISKLLLNASVVVSLLELQPDHTLFGAVRFSMLERPYISWSMSILSYFDVMRTPWLGAAVERWCVDYIMARVGFPESFTVDSGLVSANSTPVGLLHIQNVNVTRMVQPKFRLSNLIVDPYVVFKTIKSDASGDQPFSRYTTTVAWNKKTHTWPGEIFIPIYSRSQHHLMVTVNNALMSATEELLCGFVPFHVGADIEKPDCLTPSGFLPVSMQQTVIRPKQRGGEKQAKKGGKLSFLVRLVPLRKLLPLELKSPVSQYQVNPHLVRGVLTVTVERCSSLARSRASPYVRLEVIGPEGRSRAKAETRIEFQTSNPVYSELFSFGNVIGTSVLKISVVDDKPPGLWGNREDRSHLGDLTLPVHWVVTAGKVVDKFPLSGVKTGHITLICYWKTVYFFPGDPVLGTVGEEVRKRTHATANVGKPADGGNPYQSYLAASLSDEVPAGVTFDRSKSVTYDDEERERIWRGWKDPTKSIHLSPASALRVVASPASQREMENLIQEEETPHERLTSRNARGEVMQRPVRAIATNRATTPSTSASKGTLDPPKRVRLITPEGGPERYSSAQMKPNIGRLRIQIDNDEDDHAENPPISREDFFKNRLTSMNRIELKKARGRKGVREVDGPLVMTPAPRNRVITPQTS